MVASVRFVARWWVTLGCGVLSLTVAACSDSPADSAVPTTTADVVTTTTVTTAPPRPTSTTTTEFDPASVEGQVEAAYLHSWDVYAEAVYDLELDEAQLAKVYADPLLGVLRTELESRIQDGRAALVRVEHDYEIQLTGSDSAAVIDTYVNHQVLIDPGTYEPIEADPNTTIVDAFTLRRVDSRWVVFDQRRLQ